MPSKQSVSYVVHPGALCSAHASYGYSAKGVVYQCKTKPDDPAYRWRRLDLRRFAGRPASVSHKVAWRKHIADVINNW